MHIPPKFALRVQPVGNVSCNSLVGDGGKSILEPLKISQDVTKNVGIMARNEEPQPLRCSIISREQTYATLTVNLSCQFLWFDFCFSKTL